MKMQKILYKGGEGELIEKKSRFIATTRPVETEEEALAFLAEMKKKYWDATHNCSAFVIGDRQQIQRCSDDGEPQGTAGRPMLDVLLGEDIHNMAVVVTRYFGGTLLGTGGLVRAYSHTAKIAVDAGGIITMKLCKVLKVCCDYNFYGRLNSLIPECGGAIDNADFADTVTVTFKMPTDDVDNFEKKLVDLSFGKFKSEEIGEVFEAMP